MQSRIGLANMSVHPMGDSLPAGTSSRDGDLNFGPKFESILMFVYIVIINVYSGKSILLIRAHRYGG